MSDIHVGDIGTVFEATIIDQTGAIVNVSSASTKQLWFGKPDGSVLQKPALFSTDGTDGKIRYMTVGGDLSSPGVWTLQGYVVMPAGTWHSDTVQLKVAGNLL